MSWIDSGHRITWLGGPPDPYQRPNHSGAFDHATFVDGAIADLVRKGAAEPVDFLPTVVSPLNVIP